MHKTRAKTERLQVMLALKTHGLLAKLAEKGMYGTSTTDVAKTLIEEGIRDARIAGILTDEDLRSAIGSGVLTKDEPEGA
jgi:hypothetical protein